jgi:hypothetical protein
MKLKARIGAPVSVVKVGLLSIPGRGPILPMKRRSFSGVRRLAAAFLRELARASGVALTPQGGVSTMGKQENARQLTGATKRQPAAAGRTPLAQAARPRRTAPCVCGLARFLHRYPEQPPRHSAFFKFLNLKNLVSFSQTLNFAAIEEMDDESPPDGCFFPICPTLRNRPLGNGRVGCRDDADGFCALISARPQPAIGNCRFQF